jgi:hypothetical protein
MQEFLVQNSTSIRTLRRNQSATLTPEQMSLDRIFAKYRSL